VRRERFEAENAEDNDNTYETEQIAVHFSYSEI